MRLFTVLFIFCSIVSPAFGASNSFTFYLDGALCKQTVPILKENADILLPAAYIDGSLRIRPLDDCQIVGVDVISSKPDQQTEKQIATLESRRSILTDRLKALDLREATFASAAKSQSSKAPRKSKQNPEPLASVKKATEYAFSQLEEVYRGRRVAEMELKSLDKSIDTLRKKAAERIAKISMSRKGCKIETSFLRSDLNWQPSYDLRLNNSGNAELIVHAITPKVEKGTVILISSDYMKDGGSGVLWTDKNVVASYTFPVEQVKFTPYPIASIEFKMKNQSKERLANGRASCFYLGDYMGISLMKEAGPGEAMEIRCGDYSADK
jgi:hypothetical protein